MQILPFLYLVWQNTVNLEEYISWNSLSAANITYDTNSFTNIEPINSKSCLTHATQWNIVRQSVITYPKSLSDIRKVISETLTSDISETFCISDIQIYCTASFDIRKVANAVELVRCNYSLQYQTTQLTPIVIADQCQRTVDSNIDHYHTLPAIYCYRQSGT